MTKTIVTLSAAAAMAVVLGTPSFAKSAKSKHPARDAYAMQQDGYAAGWQSQNMPARAAGLWRPGQCWKDVDRLRRLGYFENCKSK